MLVVGIVLFALGLLLSIAWHELGHFSTARLFGVREIALGAVTLLASGAARRDLVAAGVLVDLGDAVASVFSYRTGEVSPLGAAPLLAVALGAAAAGAIEVNAASR